VGGFLVALAAVGVFAAYSSATAGPTTEYAVAARDLAPGVQLTAGDVRLVPIDLPDEQRQRSYDVIAPLVDATVVEPLVAGELIQEGSLIATGAEAGNRTVSFAIEAPRAVNATLKTAERIDVLATFGTGDRACTHVVAADVAVVGVSEAAGGLVGQGGSGLTVTIQVPTAESGVAVAHAAAAGTITLARTTHADAAEVERFCTPAAGAGGTPAEG
jgi:Flp pilus assembly protein CpaB